MFISSSDYIALKGSVVINDMERILKKPGWHNSKHYTVTSLEHGFPNCGTRTTINTSITAYWYAALLTYSMVQSPSWEANWFAASQEIPRILWNPKVHYRTHKRPPPVPTLCQPNPVHIPTSWRSILILSTHLRLGLPSGLFPSGFLTKTLNFKKIGI